MTAEEQFLIDNFIEEESGFGIGSLHKVHRRLFIDILRKYASQQRTEYAEMWNIKWTPKNVFQPVDGKWYWAIIQKEDGSGWYNPQTARYNNGEYYVWTSKNDVPYLMPMPKFTHIAEIIYPQTTKP